MAGNWLKRTRSICGPLPGWFAIQLAGTLSALLAILLIADLAILVNLVFDNGQLFGSEGVLGGTPAGESPRNDHRRLWALVATGVVLAALQATLLALLYRSSERAALAAAVKLKAAIHTQAFQLGPNHSLGQRGPEAQQQCTDRVAQLRAGLIAYWSTRPRSIVLLILLAMTVLIVNVWLALVGGLLALMGRVVYTRIRRRATLRGDVWEGRAASEDKLLLERLQQIPLFVGYRLEKAPGEPLDQQLDRYEQAALRGRLAGARAGPVLVFIVISGTAVLLLLAGILALREPPAVTVTGLVTVTVTLIYAFFPARRLYRAREAIGIAEQAAADIFDYLDRQPSVNDAPDADVLPALSRQLRLEAVTLADHDGRKLLDNVTLDFAAPGRVMLLASDPSAGRALAGLLIRLCDPAAGRVLFDGRDIRAVTLDSLRRQALLVDGDDAILRGSVWDNIGCADPGFTQLQIVDAAKQARAYNFIQELPQGFSTVLGSDGVQLDAGRALRIGLARAVLREPSLLVIQEPSDSIDETSAGHIEEAYRRLSGQRTVLLLPTQLETLRTADRIYLLHQGKIIAAGPHAELLQNCELYRHLNYVRFNAFRHEMG